MSKYISSEQFWDTIEEALSPQKERDNGLININKEYGNVELSYFSTGSGINYSSYKAKFTEDITIEGQNNSDISFLCFNMGSNLFIQDKKQNVEFNNDIYLRGAQYDGRKSQVIYEKGKTYLSQYLTFDIKVFEKLLNKNSIDSKDNAIHQDDYFSLFANKCINNKQKALLKELLYLPDLQSGLREIYLESKILELTYTTISDINNTKQKGEVYLSTQDVGSLKKAKQILVDNIANPPSLKELSYKSAINEFKLKKGFKQLYGTTVYGFLQEYRLNEAKRLLESSEINIGEAAKLVGYSNMGHFSNIFKKQFGIRPIDIKQEQKKFYI